MLIFYGTSRRSAIEAFGWALDHCQVLGLATNLALLRAISSEADFMAGETSTSYLETHDFDSQTLPPPITPPVLCAAALWETLSANPGSLVGARNYQLREPPYNPWTSNLAARSRAGRSFRYLYGAGEFLVTLSPVTPLGVGEDGYAVTINGEPFRGEEAAEGEADPGEPVAGSIMASLSGENRLTLIIGVQRRQAAIARSGLNLEVSYLGKSYILKKPRPLDVTSAGSPGEQPGGRRHILTAPMAGTVIKVSVREGEEVTANQPLVILGAMKMEHSIRSPYPGTIIRVPHAAGDVVSGGEILVELDTGGENSVG
jgi:3-methylcrotonyl-CoA carboxylase alpha subunit